MWDPNRLTEAHEFCKQKSERHMNMVNIFKSIAKPLVLLECFQGFEAVIIDNTNIEIWHMIFYATMALRFRYRISIEEPTTTWKLNVRELAKRNKHGYVCHYTLYETPGISVGTYKLGVLKRFCTDLKG